jgi:hypothetical protein
MVLVFAREEERAIYSVLAQTIFDELTLMEREGILQIDALLPSALTVACTMARFSAG